MFLQRENTTHQWVELARLLRTEWSGDAIDQSRALSLAASLLPHHPELGHTLRHIQRRMGA